MHGAQLACWLFLCGSACRAVYKGRVSGRVVRWAAAALLGASMACTITLVILDGKDLLRTLLPLHLCSLSAFIALFGLLTDSRGFYHFGWYLGMPGAFLALIFPAVEPSSWPLAMTTTFMLTHALVAFYPLLMLAQGKAPAPAAAGGVLLMGNVFLLVVYVVDKLLNANYMFLLWAPTGTPLAWMAGLGRPGYFACLELGAVLGIWAMRGIALGVHRIPGFVSPYTEAPSSTSSDAPPSSCIRRA